MPHTPASRNTSRGRLSGHFYWLAPLAISVLAITAALVVNPAAGADLATILALPVGVVAAVAGVLALPSVRERAAGTAPAGRRKIGRILPAVLTLVLLPWAALTAYRQAGAEADATDQLSGTVRIGISGTIPGWSEKNGDSYQGFEIDLIHFLRDRYHFHPEFVELTPAARIPALERGEVDLVIANLEVDDTRRRTVRTAGPYFIDHSGVYVSGRKLKGRPTAEKIIGCALSLTYPRPRDMGLDFLEAGSLQECLVRFFDPREPVNAVMMDHGVLAGLAVRRGWHVRDLVEYRRTGHVEYSIGVRPGSPRLCAALSKDVGDFLAGPWNASIGRHLPYLDAGNAKPLYNNGDHCRS